SDAILFQEGVSVKLRLPQSAALSPHGRWSGAMVEEAGCLSLLIDNTEMDSLIFSTFLYSYY
ncbi:hypothetical protein, partial [Escherichia coli]